MRQRYWPILRAALLCWRMDKHEPPCPSILKTVNGNSNFVLGLLHRLPPGRFGHIFVDGLRRFGVPVLFGIEPAVYLLAKALPDIRFEGRNANDNLLITCHVGPEELERRVRQHIRAMGLNND